MNDKFRTNNLSLIMLSIACNASAGISLAQAFPPWIQTRKMLASDGATGDSFGNSIALDGNIAVIGASFDDDNGRDSGSAYVFDLTTGQQLFKLLPSDGAEFDNFGTSVDLSGNLAIIGAPGDDIDGGFSFGSAYVFDVTTGQQLFKLSADDGADFDQFGISVALNGNRAVIGAPDSDGKITDSGSAYVFDVTTGQQLLKLSANDGTEFDGFGASVDISGNLAVVGAPGHDCSKFITDCGAAYVFDMTSGSQISFLSASDADMDDAFGDAVAISGDTVVVGAAGNDDAGSRSGAAYIYKTANGMQLYKLLPSDGADFDNFGISVNINANMAIIGAVLADGIVTNSGSAYLFNVTDGKLMSKLVASDGTMSDNFGSSVAIDGNRAIVGAIRVDEVFTDVGSTYVFQQQTTNLLTISPSPLKSGQTGTFSVMQALPDEQAWLLYTLNGLGQTVIPQLNVTVDLMKPKLASGPKQTDTNGDLQWILPMPNINNPLNVWFQAVQHENITNFVATQIIP